MFDTKPAVLVLCALFSSISAFASPPNLRTVTPNLLRSGRPTTSDLKELAANGVTAIVDLENLPPVVRAEADAAAALRMKFVNIPLSASVTPSDADIDRAIGGLTAGAGKVLVHCLHGQDRTGVVVALYRVEVLKWTPKQAYAEMMADGFSLKYAKPLEVYFRSRTGYNGP